MGKPELTVDSATSAPAADMRDACFEELRKIAAADRNVIVLTDDMGAFALDQLKKELASQYFNMGIAEQNIVSVAAGLALGGKRPFIYGISTFVTMRCYEQIRVDLCCMNLPVTIIGSGAGYTYGSDGPTHHATQDIAIMRALPEMTLFNPSDPVMTAAVVRMAYKYSGPAYIRIEKGILPCLYAEQHDFQRGFDVLRPGRDIMIVATGVMVHSALRVVEELSKHSLDVGVVDLYRIKPIDEGALSSSLRQAKRLITIEENSIIGGISSLIAEIMAGRSRPIPLQRIALHDRFCYEYGSREWLHAYQGLDVKSLAKTILEWK
jgi:transketolase